MKKTNYTIKFLYAIGALLIIADHCGGGGISLGYDWFLPSSFHVALFVFASGYLYEESNQQHVVPYIGKKFMKLIVPLYVWNLFYAVVVTILPLFQITIGGEVTWYNLIVAPIKIGNQFTYNFPGWFVVPLFLVQVYNILIRKLLPFVKKEWILLVLSLGIGIGGNYLACQGYYEGWWLLLVRTAYFVIFYEMGYLYKKCLEVHDKLPSRYYFGLLLVAQLVITYINGDLLTYTPSWCSDFTDGPIMPIIVAMLGILFWLRIAKIIGPIVGKTKTFLAIANHSYGIMINQFLGFMVVKGIFAGLNAYMGWFSDFNWESFRTMLWYYYLPGGLSQFYLLYLVAGVMIPIIMDMPVTFIKKKCMNRRNKGTSKNLRESGKEIESKNIS